MSFRDVVTVDMGHVERRITALAERFNNIPLAVLASDVQLAVDDLIQSEGVLSGERWQALSDETLRRHPRRIGGLLLQDTGLLANLQTFVGDDFFGVRSPAPYAGYHVTGTKNMPARDFLAVDIATLLGSLAEEIASEIVE